MDPTWESARQLMLLDAAVAYLNTGSYGPSPRPVFERVTALRRRLAEEPVAFLWREAHELLWQARTRLASFLHADAKRLIFTVNVSAAINIVAASLRLATSGEVLLTNHEYGAMRFAWERACQRQGLTLRTFPIPVQPASPSEVTAAVARALGPNTRLLLVSHVLHTTGMILPIGDICRLAHDHGVLTLVDGAHAPGMTKMDLAAWGADFYGGNLHKWLLAPIGSGFLHVAPGREGMIQPQSVSWGWHYDRCRADERDEFGGTPWLRSFEFEGTRDFCPWLAVPEAIAFCERLGADRIRKRQQELSDYVRRTLGGRRGLQLVTPTEAPLRGALTAFRLPPHDLNSLRRGLWETHRVEVPIVEHTDGNLLRVSTHFYNTEEEIDRLARAIDELLP